MSLPFLRSPLLRAITAHPDGSIDRLGVHFKYGKTENATTVNFQRLQFFFFIERASFNLQ
jgi:hypothetical protein